MAYKYNDPCLEKADEHEPIFVLLGRDPLAAEVVRFWALRAKEVGHQADKVEEALDWADRMDLYPKKPPSSQSGLFDLCEISLGHIR